MCGVGWWLERFACQGHACHMYGREGDGLPRLSGDPCYRNCKFSLIPSWMLYGSLRSLAGSTASHSTAKSANGWLKLAECRCHVT